MIETKLHNIYLGLGTNLGDKERNIRTAIENLGEKVGQVLSLSPFYETKPVGFASENNFINAVCHVKTKMQPLEILAVTQEIEKEMGRKSKSVNQVYADRIIDIDLLLFDDEIIDLPGLVLPHPHLHERDFVLFPLNDIATDLFHPVLKKTIGELKKEFDTKN